MGEEYGRHRWAVAGVLRTFLGLWRTPAGNLWSSLLGFVVFYSALAVVDAYLLTRTIRRGPDGLGDWPVAGAPLPPGHQRINPLGGRLSTSQPCGGFCGCLSESLCFAFGASTG